MGAITIEALETAFYVKEIRDGQVLLQGFDKEGKPGPLYLMPTGDTFHISYDVQYKLLDLLLAWLFNTPLRSAARTRCNCRWDKTTQE